MKWTNYTKYENEEDKIMVISRNENKTKVNIKVDGTTGETTVEQVGSFNYLGQTVSDDGRCVDEIKEELELPKLHYQK